MRAIDKGTRSAFASVSGWRVASQRKSRIPTMASTRKIMRQSATRRMSWPIDGARTGTRISTVMTKDMMRAMERPTKRSRTIAMPTMRGPAAPKPCRTRPSSIKVKSVVKAQMSPPAMKQPKPAYIAGLRPVLSEIGP